MSEMKHLKRRLEDAINVRVQLKQLGALMDPFNAKKFKEQANEFIHGAVSSQFALKVTDKSQVRVSLCSSENVQSGIVLEML